MCNVSNGCDLTYEIFHIFNWINSTYIEMYVWMNTMNFHKLLCYTSHSTFQFDSSKLMIISNSKDFFKYSIKKWNPNKSSANVFYLIISLVRNVLNDTSARCTCTSMQIRKHRIPSKLLQLEQTFKWQCDVRQTNIILDVFLNSRPR